MGRQGTRVLRIPCTSETAAAAAAEALRDDAIDVDGTDGRFLLVPAGGSSAFVWYLAEELQRHGHGEDEELARWAEGAAYGTAAG